MKSNEANSAPLQQDLEGGPCQTVYILAPFGRDAMLIERSLNSAGVATSIEVDIAPIIAHCPNCGALILTSEALSAESVTVLERMISAQEPWSDLPVILLSKKLDPTAYSPLVGKLGNLSIIERPIEARSLITMVTTALRARKKQFEIRDLLAEQKKSQEENLLLLDQERKSRALAQHESELKDQFLATLSHELRTPLNAILGWSQLIKKKYSSPDDVLKGITIIERNSRTQAQLIEDLLDMSRIISGKLRLDIKELELPAVIESAISSIHPALESKQVTFEQIIEPGAHTVMGDPARLQQILWNLLFNAVKFTPPGGTIRVQVERGKSAVKIKIVDNGKGISPEFLPNVFDRFRQADGSMTRRQGGLGLGLSIVKTLTELHGGSITAQSAGIDKGATFTLSLPVATPNKPSPTEPRANIRAPHYTPVGSADQSIDLSNLSILVVDDEADSRNVIKELLIGRGAEVLCAHSVDDALSILVNHSIDLLISDIGMPERDGYELISTIRQLEEQNLKQIPAIALTAFARAEDRVKAAKAGFQRHIAKPVEFDELISIAAELTHRTV